MNSEQAVQVIRNMVKNGGLCGYVSGLLLNNFEMMNSVRKEAQNEAGKRYKEVHDINVVGV